jgi:hypothetical protein
LQPLPPRRTNEYEEVDARVTKFAVFTVRAVAYSAPSRLIGHRQHDVNTLPAPSAVG